MQTQTEVLTSTQLSPFHSERGREILPPTLANIARYRWTYASSDIGGKIPTGTEIFRAHIA